MKRLVFFILVLVSYTLIAKTKKDYNILNCHIIEIKEYKYAFRFIALNRNNTILIISLKENYYKKYGYKKPVLNNLEKIKENEKYNFYLTQIRPTVSTMEQLGAYIIIENDTLWKSKSYKKVPFSFISYNTIGQFYSK